MENNFTLGKDIEFRYLRQFFEKGKTCSIIGEKNRMKLKKTKCINWKLFCTTLRGCDEEKSIMEQINTLNRRASFLLIEERNPFFFSFIRYFLPFQDEPINSSPLSRNFLLISFLQSRTNFQSRVYN